MRDLRDIIFDITNIEYKDIDIIFEQYDIKNQILKELERVRILFLKKALSKQSEKLLINVSGIPGAGKTTYCKKILDQIPYLNYVSFDAIMESILYYQVDMKNDPQYAFTKWEIPARILGYEILIELISKGLPILFEHSSANFQHVELFKYIKEKLGYKIEMHFVPIALKDALIRVKKRERLTKRYTPEELVVDRKLFLQQNLSYYKNIVDVFKEAR